MCNYDVIMKPFMTSSKKSLFSHAEYFTCQVSSFFPWSSFEDTEVQSFSFFPTWLPHHVTYDVIIITKTFCISSRVLGENFVKFLCWEKKAMPPRFDTTPLWLETWPTTSSIKSNSDWVADHIFGVSHWSDKVFCPTWLRDHVIDDVEIFNIYSLCRVDHITKNIISLKPLSLSMWGLVLVIHF